jgi:hypothetical protein
MRQSGFGMNSRNALLFFLAIFIVTTAPYIISLDASFAENAVYNDTLQRWSTPYEAGPFKRLFELNFLGKVISAIGIASFCISIVMLLRGKLRRASWFLLLAVSLYLGRSLISIFCGRNIFYLWQ